MTIERRRRLGEPHVCWSSIQRVAPCFSSSMKTMADDGGLRLAAGLTVTRRSRTRRFEKRRKSSPFRPEPSCRCGTGPSSSRSAAPQSARKSTISCCKSRRARSLSGTRYERRTAARASSRRGGGRSRKSRPPPNRCFPKTFHGACASFGRHERRPRASEAGIETTAASRSASGPRSDTRAARHGQSGCASGSSGRRTRSR